MSYTLQPDHYPGLKITVNSEQGELALQSFEPYSKSRPHLVEMSVNGNVALLGLSNIQGCFSSCKGAEVGERKMAAISQLEIETIVRNASKDKKSIKIKIDGKSVVVTNQDFQKALTELKQHRAEQLKKSES